MVLFRLRGNQNYLDYDDGASSSHEGAEKQKDYSLENSAEYVDQYNNRFNDDYKDKKVCTWLGNMYILYFI